MARRLTFEFVQQYFKNHNCKLLEKEYINIKTKMRYRCSCGNKECKISFDKFKRGHRCKECRGGIKFTFEEVYNYFEEQKCELLETEYVNAHTKMRYRCKCKNISKICFGSFKRGHRCRKCYLKRNSGKNNHFYNPNLTDEEREKGRICPGLKKWRKLILERDNNTCQCCFQTDKKLIAHHIENYSNNKELRTVLSNGFLFCKEHHIEFHKEYGYDCNREQLEDFLNSKIKINY